MTVGTAATVIGVAGLGLILVVAASGTNRCGRLRSRYADLVRTSGRDAPAASAVWSDADYHGCPWAHAVQENVEREYVPRRGNRG